MENGNVKQFALGLGFVVARIVALSCGCGWVGAYCGFASIPFLIIGFWNAIPDRLWPAAITTSSFPIYLIHMFFYPIVDLCCNKNSPVGYIFEFSSVFVLSLIMSIVIRRFLPRFASIAFGGR